MAVMAEAPEETRSSPCAGATSTRPSERSSSKRIHFPRRRGCRGMCWRGMLVRRRSSGSAHRKWYGGGDVGGGASIGVLSCMVISRRACELPTVTPLKSINVQFFFVSKRKSAPARQPAEMVPKSDRRFVPAVALPCTAVLSTEPQGMETVQAEHQERCYPLSRKESRRSRLSSAQIASLVLRCPVSHPADRPVGAHGLPAATPRSTAIQP